MTGLLDLGTANSILKRYFGAPLNYDFKRHRGDRDAFLVRQPWFLPETRRERYSQSLSLRMRRRIASRVCS